MGTVGVGEQQAARAPYTASTLYIALNWTATTFTWASTSWGRPRGCTGQRSRAPARIATPARPCAPASARSWPSWTCGPKEKVNEKEEEEEEEENKKEEEKKKKINKERKKEKRKKERGGGD